MKKILFLFLLAITSVGISGCGSSSESTKNNESTKSSESDKSSESTPKQDTRTEIDVVLNQTVTITKEEEGKYIIQKQQVTDPITNLDASAAVTITVNGVSQGLSNSITLKEGDQVTAVGLPYAGIVAYKLTPTK